MKEFLFLLGLCGLVGIDRQAQGKSGSLAVVTAGIDTAAVVMHDKITSHQMNSVFDRAVAPNHKGIENQSQGFLRQTGPIITELDLDFLLSGSGALQRFG